MVGQSCPILETHLLLSSKAIRMMRIRSSGGRVLRLQLRLVVNTLLPICRDTDEESP